MSNGDDIRRALHEAYPHVNQFRELIELQSEIKSMRERAEDKNNRLEERIKTLEEARRAAETRERRNLMTGVLTLGGFVVSLIGILWGIVSGKVFGP